MKQVCRPWRQAAVGVAVAMLVGLFVGIGPAVTFAADCPVTHVDPNCVPGGTDPKDDPDPCAVMTHVPPGCLEPDPEDDPDPCAVMTHIPQGCLPDPDPDDEPDPDPEDKPDPDPEDKPDPGNDPEDEPEPDSDTSTDISVDPIAAPDLPMTGGTDVGWIISGTLLLAIGAGTWRRRTTGR